MLILRTFKETRDYFETKWTEWFMALPALGMAIALYVQPDVFQTGPQYATLDRWAEEETWARILIIAFMIRLIALITHHTSSFLPLCPFLRLFGALFGIYIWGEFSVGLSVNAARHGTAIIPVVAYTSLLLIECRNSYKAASDVGIWYKTRGGGK